MDVRAIEASRTRRYGFHRPTQEAADLPPLVPPHHGPAVHLVFVH